MECLKPLTIPHPTRVFWWDPENPIKISVPCNKCVACLQNRRAHWSFRLQQELKVSSSSHFVTLTYDEKHVPKTTKNVNTLNKADLQDFFKRLRKKTSNRLRYYAVGEYGSKTHRPHYHVILFNATAQAVCETWNKGHTHIGQLTPASCGYTLKYIAKKKQTQKPNDDRAPIFSVMSKGLGLHYCTDPAVQRWHTSDLSGRYYIPAGGGVKASMPRYYRDRLYTAEQFGHLKGVLEKNALEKSDELHKKYSNWHIAQLHIQQFNKIQKDGLNEKL